MRWSVPNRQKANEQRKFDLSFEQSNFAKATPQVHFKAYFETGDCKYREKDSFSWNIAKEEMSHL